MRLTGWSGALALAVLAAGASVIDLRDARAARAPTSAEIGALLHQSELLGTQVELPADGKPLRIHLRKSASGGIEAVVVDKAPRGALEIGKYEIELAPENGSWIRPSSQTRFVRYPEGAPERVLSVRVDGLHRWRYDEQAQTWVQVD